MQKALIIQSGGFDVTANLNAGELNTLLSDGWFVVHTCPFGVSVSESGDGRRQSAFAAVLVILDRATAL